MPRPYRPAPIALLCLACLLSGCAAEAQEGYVESVTGPTGEVMTFEMVPLPGGTFVMGSDSGEAGHQPDEAPPHELTVAPFYLASKEVTLQLFLAYYRETKSEKDSDADLSGDAKGIDGITGPTPVYGDITMGYPDTNPAMGMSWHNAVTFARWLSAKTGRAYRLPTEAEWEYACRAGTATLYGIGDDPAKLERHAWYEKNAEGEPKPVGTRQPNAWGLYDLQGNVREWVQDIYDPQSYARYADAIDDDGVAPGRAHVARGGDYASPVEELRCAARDFEEPWWRSYDPQIPKSQWWIAMRDFIGMRVAVSIE